MLIPEAAISTGVVSLLAPHLKALVNIGKQAGEKVLEGAGEEAGKDTWSAAKAIWKRLQPELKSNPIAKDALQHAVENPDDPRTRQALDLQLERALNANGPLKEKITRILKKVPNSVMAVAIGSNAQIIAGNTFSNSNVTITSSHAETTKSYKPVLRLRSPQGIRGILEVYAKIPNDLFLDILTREAAAQGLPNSAWANVEIAKSAERQPRPSDQDIRETYAGQVRQWHEWWGQRALDIYEHKRWMHRSFFLKLQIINIGQAPAERVLLECKFPHELILDETEPYIFPIMYMLESNNQSAPKAVTPEREFPEWSKDLTLSPRVLCPPYDPAMAEYSIEDGNVLRAHIEILEHGDAVFVGPIRISFREEGPIRTFNFSYRLHASNQARDLRGQETIKIRSRSVDAFGRPLLRPSLKKAPL